MSKLDPRVVALGSLRFALPGSPEVMYEATGIDGTPDEQHRAVDWIFRQAMLSGKHEASDYACLDGYDVNGDIVADYGIPTREKFKFLYRKLNWSQSRFKEST